MRPEGTGEKKDKSKDSSSQLSAKETDSTYDESGKKKKEIDGVFKVQKGVAVFVPVKLGIRDQQNVEVVSGVSDGDSIITGPFRLLRTIKPDDTIEAQKSKMAGTGTENE